MPKRQMMWRMVIWLLGLSLGPQAVASPKIEHWQTSNGARVVFVPSPGLPMVDIRLVFDAGSARDQGKEGLAVFTNALLTESAGPWSADQLAERLENVGAKMKNGAERDMAWVSVRSLTDQQVLDTTLEALTAVVSKPAFIDKDVERIRQSMLAALQQEAESPGAVAQKIFYGELYKGHPYASNPAGNLEQVKSIQVADIKAFHRQYYVASNTLVAIVGDLNTEQAKALAERAVAGLPGGQRPALIPEPQPPEQAVLRVIPFPSSQTHIYAGQPGAKRGDPDYFPLYVGNHILGGSGLVSILSEEVREKRGLSYSVSSYFLPMRVAGPFQLGAQTRNSQAEQTLQVMRETLGRFISEGPTDEELKAAKDNISGGFPMKIASNSKIVEYIAMIGFYELPLDYLEQLVPKVLAVTKEEIRDAFRRRLAPERFVTIMVGEGQKENAPASR